MRQADDTADIVAETFLVAWRRIDEVLGPGLIASSAGPWTAPITTIATSETADFPIKLSTTPRA
jgi:DNA-directed RNA polymerase specialized sigma24 family protein